MSAADHGAFRVGTTVEILWGRTLLVGTIAEIDGDGFCRVVVTRGLNVNAHWSELRIAGGAK